MRDKTLANIYTHTSEHYISTPYTKLASAIVLVAIEDYRTYLIQKKKGVMYYEGLSARKFLNSKMANWYANVDTNMNIRELVELQVNQEEDIDEYYERLKKERLYGHQRVFKIKEVEPTRVD